MPTNMRRITISFTPELEHKLVELRKTDEYCECSLAEIVRSLMKAALEKDDAG